MNTLTVKDFSVLFGATEDSFSLRCREIIDSKNFNYISLTPEEEKKAILDIVKKIDNLSFSSPNLDKWNLGWGANLSKFQTSRDPFDLLPTYGYSRRMVRLMGKYAVPESLSFEEDLKEVQHYWVFENFIDPDNCSKIYEFGCGTGITLLELNEMYPNIDLVGLDWSTSAIEIINLLSETNSRISGKLFNGLEDRVLLEDNSCIFTTGFLEQLSDKFHNFLDSAMESKVRCVHLEPIEEFYSQDNIFDYLAYKYHHLRGYLKGFSTHLRSLDGTKIKIIKEKKAEFGNLFHDGWSMIIWETI